MLYCPTCGNVLLLEKSSGMRFFCQTCPYIYGVSGEITQEVNLIKKAANPILGTAEAWEGADKTNNTCPKCENPEAYWMQIQIRSADEPSTRFYKCCKCGHSWKED